MRQITLLKRRCKKAGRNNGHFKHHTFPSSAQEINNPTNTFSTFFTFCTFLLSAHSALKFLFLSNRIPYPPFRGDKLKIYNLAKRLAAKGHTLHLITFMEEAGDEQYRPELEQIFEKVVLVHLPKRRAGMNVLGGVVSRLPFQVSYFKSKEMQRKLNTLLQQERYDAVHVQHLRMAPYLEHRADLPRILDLPDAFSLYWQRRKAVKKNPLKKSAESWEAGRVFRYEQQVLQRFNRTLCCSAEDLKYLQEKHGADNLSLLPNGVDLATFYPKNHDYSHNHTLLFTGNMDYAPNVDAVVYFCKEVLPLIRKKQPQVKFVIAGQRPVAAVKALAQEVEHVAVTGFVADLTELYNAASVVVAPLRFGAGTQNKVLEAMAMGIPVVCSHIGFGGLGIENGEGAIMRTDAVSFADAVVHLLDSEAARKALGEKAARVIEARFGWDAIAALLEQYLKEVAVAGR